MCWRIFYTSLEDWSQVEIQWHFSSVIRVVFRLIYNAMRSDKCLFLHDHQEKSSWSDINLLRIANLFPDMILPISQRIAIMELIWTF
jgi:hypothetical protein